MLEEGWNKVDGRSSAGWDGISPRLQRLIEDMKTVRTLGEQAIREGGYFSSRATLIPKKDGSSRPIQVQGLFTRCIEKAISWKLYKNTTFDSNLYGFIPKKSTHDAWKDLADTVRTEMKKKDPKDRRKVLFLDFSKAYNLLNTEKLKDIIRRQQFSEYEERYLIKSLEEQKVWVGGKFYRVE